MAGVTARLSERIKERLWVSLFFVLFQKQPHILVAAQQVVVYHLAHGRGYGAFVERRQFSAERFHCHRVVFQYLGYIVTKLFGVLLFLFGNAHVAASAPYVVFLAEIV